MRAHHAVRMLLVAAMLTPPAALAWQTPAPLPEPAVLSTADFNRVPSRGDTSSYLQLIEQAIETGRSNHKVSRRTSQRLDDMHGRIATIVDQYDDLADIPQDRRMRLLESQKIIGDILADTRRSDWTCSNAAPTGSRLARVQCTTKDDAALVRRGSREWTEKMQQVGCVPGEGNCSR